MGTVNEISCRLENKVIVNIGKRVKSIHIGDPLSANQYVYLVACSKSSWKCQTKTEETLGIFRQIKSLFILVSRLEKKPSSRALLSAMQQFHLPSVCSKSIWNNFFGQSSRVILGVFKPFQPALNNSSESSGVENKLYLRNHFLLPIF